MKVRALIAKLYRWGVWKRCNFRFAGIDVRQDGEKGQVTLDQEFYLETIGDLDIESHLLRGDTEMSERDKSEVRRLLGALAWLATQTAPLISARVGLLLSSMKEGCTYAVARAASETLRDARREVCTRVVIGDLDETDPKRISAVVFQDSAFMNRADGSSTGGLVAGFCSVDALKGGPVKINMVNWKSWKLERKATSSNDAETQSLAVGEDMCFRLRLLWGEMNGIGTDFGMDIRGRVAATMTHISGITVSDSKGAFDAVMMNTSATLGLCRSRTAIEAMALKQSFEEDENNHLVWLAGDWNISDALTKEKAECRQGLREYLRTRVWRLKFDPKFIVSARKAKVKAIDEFRHVRSVIARAASETAKDG